MAKPFPAYKGEESYIFISYSHADQDAVFGEIRWIQDQGIKVYVFLQVFGKQAVEMIFARFDASVAAAIVSG